MKLYYLPGACSLASHILLKEAGVDFEVAQVERGTGKTVSGEDYSQVNPLGYVPALKTPDAGTLIENGAVIPYLADKFGFEGSEGRYRMFEELSYLSTELHKAFSPFFRDSNMEPEAREAAVKHLHSRLQRYEDEYAASDFSAAKTYAFVITGWARHIGVSLEDYPRILAMQAAFAERPAVQAALKAEGLA